MATFSPQLGGGIGYEQPIESPSLLGGIASLVGTGLSTVRTQGQSGGVSAKDAYDRELSQNFADGLMKAEALRAQGKSREADVMIRSVKTNYYKAGGDLGSADAKAAIESITGVPAEDAGFSTEENIFKDVSQSPEFADAYLAARAMHPNANENELASFALSTLQTTQANKVIVEQTKSNWNSQQGVSSRVALVDSWVNANLGGLNVLAQSGSNLDLTTVQSARAGFNQLKAEVTASRPTGLDQDSWKPVEDYLQKQEDVLTYLETLATDKNISARHASELVGAISTMDTLTPMQKVIASQLVSDPNVFIERGLFTQDEIQNILNSVNSVTPDNTAAMDVENFTDSAFTQEELDAAASDPYENFKRAENLAKLAGTKDIMTDDKTRNSWVAEIRGGLTDLYKMASSEQWSSAEGYQKFFTPSFYKNMENLKKADPSSYTALRVKAIDALTTNKTAIVNGIESRLQGSAVRYDRNSNKLVVDHESLLASSVIAPGIADNFFSALDTYYGGDIGAALQDGGTAFTRNRNSDSDAMVAHNAWYNIASTLGNKDLPKMTKAINQLNATQTRLTPIADANPQDTGAVDPRISSSGGGFALLNLIDKKEGGGSYDTLFDHSQRSTFKGVKVSNMTIGELKQFANGRYGEWSKGRLGYKATPMGRYQFVGTTLASTAKAMGIPDTAVFTPELQDAMFTYKVRERLSGKTSVAAKRSALRAEWEGFKSVSDAELDAAIKQFEEGGPIDFGGVSVATRESAPTESAAPMARPQGLTTESAGGTVTSSVSATTGTEQAQTATESPSGESQGASGTQVAQGEDSVVDRAQRDFEALSDQSKALLQALDIKELEPEIIAYLKEQGVL